MVETVPKRCIQRQQRVRPDLLLSRDTNADWAPSLRHKFLVPIRHVLFAFVEDGKAHDMPASGDGRTFSTSRTHRLVIQAHGHSGSNQKSTCVGTCADM